MKTINEVIADTNFTIGIKLQEIELYLIWNGGPRMSYVAFRNNKILFEGDDFRPGMMTAPDSADAVISCLSFLCVRPGDTDSSYFAGYTRTQMAWVMSRECEDVQCLISDYENEDSDYHAQTRRDVSNAIIR